MKRTISKIIIHCSSTPEGVDIKADTIAKWHKKRGFKSIGYHYVIDLDGTIENGRPLTQPATHCEGANDCSIAICYIGGLDENGNPKDTRTPEQHDALLILLTELKAEFPDIQIYGLNKLNPTKNSPCFDVQAFLKEVGL